MLDLGKHTGAVLSAYGISLGILLVLVWVSIRQATKSKRILTDTEKHDG